MIEDNDPRLEPYRHIGDPRWLEANGLFVAESRLVVERLLAQSEFAVESILVTPTALPAIQPLVRDAATLYVAPQPVVNAITGFNFHRGCLALVRRPDERRPLTAFAGARRLVVLEGVGNPDNIGGIFRSGAALGAGGVVLDAASGDPLYRKAVRTSMGAVLRLPFARVENLAESLAALRALGFVVLALTPSGSATLESVARTLRGDTRVALVAGAEGPGLSPDVLAKADTTVRIPVDPHSDSLNVVVAVSIALSVLGPASAEGWR